MELYIHHYGLIFKIVLGEAIDLILGRKKNTGSCTFNWEYQVKNHYVFNRINPIGFIKTLAISINKTVKKTIQEI